MNFTRPEIRMFFVMQNLSSSSGAGISCPNYRTALFCDHNEGKTRDPQSSSLLTETVNTPRTPIVQ